MANNHGMRCPKCGHFSEDAKVCEACGALISKIRKKRLEEDMAGYTGVSHGGPGTSWTKYMLVAVVVLAVAAFAFLRMRGGETAGGTGLVNSVFTENFDAEVLESPKPVLVDFHATWCGPCKILAPHVEQMASDFSTKLKVVKVDIDRDPDLARRFSVQGVPTLVLLKNGSEVTRSIGAMPLAQLKSKFEPHL